MKRNERPTSRAALIFGLTLTLTMAMPALQAAAAQGSAGNTASTASTASAVRAGPGGAAGTAEEALLGLASAADRAEKSIAASGLDKSAGALQTLRGLGLGYSTAYPLPTAAKILSARSNEALYVLRGMYEADMAYAAAFNKRVDGILTQIARIDETTGYPGTRIEQDARIIEAGEGVSRGAALLKAMARASMADPDLVHALVSSLYGQVVEGYHLIVSLGLSSGNAGGIITALAEQGTSLAVLDDLSGLYQEFILAKLGANPGASAEFTRFADDPALHDRVVQDMLDTWDRFIAESEFGEVRTSMDIEGKSRVIGALLEVTARMKPPATEADLRKVAAITAEVRTATLSDAPAKAPALPPMPAFASPRNLSGNGFDTSIAELSRLFRFYYAVVFDPESKVRVDWNGQMDRLQVREIAKTKVRYGYAVEKVGRRQVIAIRGTANFRNVLVDASTWKNRNPALGIRLHEGFDRSATLLYEDVMPFLDKKLPVVVIGHSLGAAQAMIVGMYLQKDGYTVEKVIAAGPPKVTDAEGWAAYAELPVILVSAGYDPVPFLPPAFLYTKDPFVHQKPLLMLLDRVYSSAMPPAFYNQMKQASAEAKKAGSSLNVADHLTVHYIHRMDSKAAELRFVSPDTWMQFAKPIGK